MDDNSIENIYLSDYYEEFDISEIMEKSAGSKIWVTGLVVSISSSGLVLGDPTGKLEVYGIENSPIGVQAEGIVRVLGRTTGNNHVEADWIIPLNMNFRQFVQMREIEKRHRK